MELTHDAVAVLTPLEMRQMRRLAGWTLLMLSRSAQVSVPQLSEYENGRNGLRPDQVLVCRRLLMQAAAQRGAKIAKLCAPENAANNG